MKYKYTVKKDGVLYKPGTEVPDGLPMKEKFVDNKPMNAASVDVNENSKQAQEPPKRGRKPKEA